MDDKLRNRRLLIGAGIALLLLNAGVRHFVHHGFSFSWSHDDSRSDNTHNDSDKADDDKGDKATPAENSAAQLTMNNKDGSVGINIPGFSANVHIPGMNLDKGNFDIDGVKLYPGSKIGQMNVTGNAKSDDADGHGSVALDFDAPAPPATVRAYYVDAFKAHGYTVDADSTIDKLKVTKGDDDSHVEVAVAPGPNNTTHGAIAASGND